MSNKKGQITASFLLKIFLVLVILYFTAGRLTLRYVSVVRGNNVKDNILKIERELERQDINIKSTFNKKNYLGLGVIDRDIYDRSGYITSELNVNSKNAYFNIDETVDKLDFSTVYSADEGGYYAADINGDIIYVGSYSYKNLTSPIYIFNQIKDKIMVLIGK